MGQELQKHIQQNFTSSSVVLVVIGSMPMPICNSFHERLANNGKIMTFAGIPLFDALMCRFPWTYKIET